MPQSYGRHRDALNFDENAPGAANHPCALTPGARARRAGRPPILRYARLLLAAAVWSPRRIHTRSDTFGPRSRADDRRRRDCAASRRGSPWSPLRVAFEPLVDVASRDFDLQRRASTNEAIEGGENWSR